MIFAVHSKEFAPAAEFFNRQVGRFSLLTRFFPLQTSSLSASLTNCCRVRIVSRIGNIGNTRTSTHSILHSLNDTHKNATTDARRKEFSPLPTPPPPPPPRTPPPSIRTISSATTKNPLHRPRGGPPRPRPSTLAAPPPPHKHKHTPLTRIHSPAWI